MEKTVIDVLEELESTPGSIDKRNILELNRSNLLLQRAFVAAQDPYTVYYVNKFKAPKALEQQVVDDDKAINALFEVVLPQLSNREVTGNAAKELLWYTYQLLDRKSTRLNSSHRT